VRAALSPDREDVRGGPRPYGWRMRAATVRSLAVLALVLPLGACGDSQEEKAQAAVCSARDDISKQVDELKSLTPATLTTDAVRENVGAIRKDLADIQDARGNLSDDRRQEVEAANKAFSSEVRGIAGEALQSISASDAKTQLTAAAQKLADSYKQSFAKVDCG
jgi:hypothetical protein